ncbi:ABC transporter permease [Paenarthrobacter sp. NPDC090520]|uniref:ABC transporter permease n=1 Tax=Paenarthrobacter sp. NPDC090520 TaxID=3364382 RepID=UPI0037FC53CA
MSTLNGTLLRFELKRHFKSKGYWAASMLVPLVVIVLAILSQLGASAATTASQGNSVTGLKFFYVDPNGVIDDRLAEESGGTQVYDTDSAIKDVVNGTKNSLLVFPSDVTTGRINIYENSTGLVGDQKSSAVARQLLQISLAKSDSRPGLIKPLTGTIDISRVGYRNGVVDPGLQSVAPPLIYLLLYFVVTMFLGNQTMGSFAEEREQKIREILFLDASPTTVFTTKILTTAILGLTQLVCMLLPMALFYFAFGANLGLPSLALHSWVLDGAKLLTGFVVLLLGIGFMVSVHAAIGARLRNVREGSGFAALFAVLMFAPGYALGLISEQPNSQIVQVLTFFPPTAPSTLLFRNAFGNISLAQVVVASLVLAVTTIAVFAVGQRAYVGRGIFAVERRTRRSSRGVST